QEGAFALLAAKLGYAAAVKWDVYAAPYNAGGKLMRYSMIGWAENGFPLHPSYRLFRMLTHAAPRGWRAVNTSRIVDGAFVTAFRGGSEMSAFLVNDSDQRREFELTGMPERDQYVFIDWNADGRGHLRARRPAGRTGGKVLVTLEPYTIAVVSTQKPGLGL
ncbi:MAG: hypothetical protein HY925_12395, partial [Elusimicrobia bacterium]|nr:hypothetical protein [Elusimicrobiota bacterium]